ncbi:MAG: sulfatase-like hydrolase/transferase, partial [Gemmatimonadota bacterium]
MLGIWGCGTLAKRKTRPADALKRPPNIVLILVDDLGWTDPQCYGSAYHETPNIDRLCSQGMKFTSAYAAAACCSPTRAAVMTGRYPARSGITDVFRWHDYSPGVAIPEWRPPVMGGSLRTPFEGYYLDLNEITIAEALRTVGYRSCHVGKWHLG